ncbi:MAG TPA: hypothetical protein VMG31_09580 [Verrucomicrobiae bacterium]|nr:hypothetical protein [Verrucomicrobiae bacterium]
MIESYLLDAGWMFFAAWSVIVGAAVVAAFGKDLIPARVRVKSATQGSAADHPPSPAVR